MTIIERPEIGEFQRFLCKGGSIQFVIGAGDVDPEGHILSHLSFETLTSGFQIPREFHGVVTRHLLGGAMTCDVWCEIERLIAWRGGTINYKQRSPGVYQATCLIALGGVLDVEDLATGRNSGSHFSASL